MVNISKQLSNIGNNNPRIIVVSTIIAGRGFMWNDPRRVLELSQESLYLFNMILTF